MSNRNPEEKEKQGQWKKPEDENNPKREQPRQPGQPPTENEKDPNKRRSA
jgi:hypothetical protein